MNLESLYQEIILDHYRHPRTKGLRDPFDAQVHHVNPTCGDEITLRVDIELGGKPLDEVWPVLEEFVHLIEGRGKVEPDEDVLGDGIAFAGVAAYPARVKCALLGWMAFKDATLQALGKDFT